VNASILTDSGGTWSVSVCVPLCSDSSVSIDLQLIRLQPPGHPARRACNFNLFNPGYEADLKRIRKDMIVATMASSLISCVIMGSFGVHYDATCVCTHVFIAPNFIYSSIGVVSNLNVVPPFRLQC